jgi:DNA-binding response OmpR family regulator
MSAQAHMYKTGSKLKILVVDDDPVICDSIKEHLSTKGFLVATAGDAAKAEALIKSSQMTSVSRYSIILLDINLADGNGLDLLMGLRAKKLIYCPVVVISGDAQPANVARAKTLGVDSFLIKPFDPLALELRVNLTLTQKT